jgi:hypothetical protein
MSGLFLCLVLLDNRLQDDWARATTPPNVVMVATRLPLLRKGMTESETEKALGVDGCLLGSGGGTLRSRIVSYPVRPGYGLTLIYHFDSKRGEFTLSKAELHSRWHARGSEE